MSSEEKFHCYTVCIATLLIKNGTLFTPSGRTEADLLVEDGTIKSIGSPLADARDDIADEVIDATGKFIFPAFIDCHVHFREPGFPHKATMASEAAAARTGGVTTVCEMPNTNPPCFTIDAFRDKVERASKVDDCDIRFFFGSVELGHLDNFKALWTGDDPIKERCCGIKLFLENSTGDLKIADGLAEAAFKLCAEIDANITAHCEDPTLNAKAAAESTGETIEFHSIIRPPESEAASIQMALDLVRKYGTRFHVAHLSTALGLELVRAAKAEGLPVTTEACPHHLLLSTEDYPRLGTHVKMNPPVRAPGNQEALWEAVADGTIDCLATDHAPHTLEEKATDQPLEAPSGVPGVETLIPLMLTKAAEGAITYERLYNACFTRPNQIYSLGKDAIEVGMKPELVIVDPTATKEITRESIVSKCGWSPFEGMKTVGTVNTIHRLEAAFQ